MRLFLASLFTFLSLGAAAMACPNYQMSTGSFTYTGQQLYSPTSFGVQAGGPNALSNCGLGGLGTGYFRSAPDYSFDLSGMEPYRLVIDVDSGCDAALLVNTADGQWMFDDDSNGNLDPRVEIANLAQINGRVDVWVGTYNGGACNATVTLETFFNQAPAPAPTPQPAAACPTWNMQGPQVQLSGSQLMATQRYGVMAQGSTNLSSCPGIDGYGYFNAAPDYSFYLDGMGQNQLQIAVNSPCDSALLVNTADTQWHFNDDGNGNLDPLLVLSGGQALNGRVDVWVGNYSGGNCTASLELTALQVAPAPQPVPQPAAGCPTFSVMGPQINATGQFLYAPQAYPVTAGGTTPVSNCGIPGGGYANMAPSYSFMLSGMDEYRLVIDVVSACDATLLVNTADGVWHYDDDSNGNLDPRIELRGAGMLNGRVDVWVGTYNGANCGATLNMETWFN